MYDNIKFPEGTRWMKIQEKDWNAWYLIGPTHAVHFWWSPPLADVNCSCVAAGIETHTFCPKDDSRGRPCCHSPTHACRPYGTSMGGNELYERAVRDAGVTEDDDVIWSTLIRYYNDRVNVRED